MEDNSVVEVLEGGKTIKLNFVSALVQYKGEFRVKLEHLLQAKDTEDVPKFMEKYKSYKSRYMETVKFDPSTPGPEFIKAAATAANGGGTFWTSGEHFGPKFTLFCRICSFVANHERLTVF